MKTQQKKNKPTKKRTVQTISQKLLICNSLLVKMKRDLEKIKRDRDECKEAVYRGIDEITRLSNELKRLNEYKKCDIERGREYLGGLADDIIVELSKLNETPLAILVPQDGVPPNLLKCIGEHRNFQGVRLFAVRELKPNTFIICHRKHCA